MNPIRDGHTMSLHIDDWSGLIARLHCPYEGLDLEKPDSGPIPICRRDTDPKSEYLTLFNCKLKRWFEDYDLSEVFYLPTRFDITTVPVCIEWWYGADSYPVIRPYEPEYVQPVMLMMLTSKGNGRD